jgi:hypothetical protein
MPADGSRSVDDHGQMIRCRYASHRSQSANIFWASKVREKLGSTYVKASLSLSI